MSLPLNDSRIHKLRASCDLCTRSKLKCDGSKPACRRCADRHVPCVYSRMGRVGRPPRLGPHNTAAPPAGGRNHPRSPKQRHNWREQSVQANTVGTCDVSSGDKEGYDFQEKEGDGQRLQHDVAAQNSPYDLEDAVNPDANQQASLLCQFSDGWNHWPSECTDVAASASDLDDLDRLLSPISQDKLSETTLVLEESAVESHILQPLDQPGDSQYYPLDLCKFQNSSAGTRGKSDGDNGRATSQIEKDTNYVHLDKIMQSEGQRTAATSPSTSCSEMDRRGELDEAWHCLDSGTTQIHHTLENIALRPQSLRREVCSCPSLIAKLQLIATHPRLTMVYNLSGAEETISESCPLDLLLFIDGVVYQTVSYVLSCRECGRDRRTRLNLCLHVDWLSDLITQVLESGLSRMLSLRKTHSPGLMKGAQNDITRSGFSGSGFSGTAFTDKDVVDPFQKDDDSIMDDDSTATLRVGSFQLNGTVWKMCIRDILKYRLLRMTRTLKTYLGRRQSEQRIIRDSRIPISAVSEEVLETMYTRVCAKMEGLFGMVEMCQFGLL